MVLTAREQRSMAASLPHYKDIPYVVSCDLGQASDYTAIVVLESQVFCDSRMLEQHPWSEVSAGWNAPATMPPAALAHTLGADLHPWPQRPPVVLRHLERVRGISYVDVVQHLVKLLSQPPLPSVSAHLVIDHTGVGRGIVDMLREAGVKPWAISIHGGDRPSVKGYDLRVPKRDLVAAVQRVLSERRLLIPSGLEGADVLMQELRNFRVTIDPRTAHDSYSAWREKDHDDEVLALAMACWHRDRWHTYLDAARIARARRNERNRR